MGKYGSIILLIVMILIMYLLLIRPQRKREKETKAMRDAIRVGDEIITIGGICGKVVKTKEETLVIQVGAGKTKFEVMRWSVSQVVNQGKRPAVTRAEEEKNEEEPKQTTPKRLKKADSAQDNDHTTSEEADSSASEHDASDEK